MLGDGAAAYTPGVAERRNGTSKFFHGDYLNSITRETDASQNTTATKQYDAFGMPVSSTGSSASPFGFAGCFGYQEDPDSGLKLLGHRYYDPSTGRFLTRDPAKDGRNWYAYCENNPLSFVDPRGLENRVTWLYKLVRGEEKLKWGITWNPGTRYSKKYLKKIDAKLDPIAQYEDRALARADERVLAEEMPGPMNKEPWAGKKLLGIAIPILILIFDPDPVSKGMALGDLLIAVVEEPVAVCQEGWWAYQNGGRAGICPEALYADIYPN